MLGIRTAPKEDLGASSAELVYGAPLTVPGDFLANPVGINTPAKFLPALRDTVRSFAPVPTSRHGTFTSTVPPDLITSKFVFVRRAQKNPLQNHYDGPFQVLQNGDKTFTLDKGGRPEVVTIDRLKPAHLDIDRPVQVAAPPRRGRPPRIPQSDPVLQPSEPTQQPSPSQPPAITTRSGRKTRTPRWLSDNG